MPTANFTKTLKSGYVIKGYDDGTFTYINTLGMESKSYKTQKSAESMASKAYHSEATTIVSQYSKTYKDNSFDIFQYADGKWAFSSQSGVAKGGYKTAATAEQAAKNVIKKEIAAAEKVAADLAHAETEKAIGKIDASLQTIYSQAQAEVEQKAADYFAQFAVDLQEKEAAVQAGEMTAAEFKSWKQSKMLVGDSFNALAENLALDLVNRNVLAADIINKGFASAYADNFNFATYQIEHASQISTSFTLYDKRTVEDLVKNKPDLLPHAEVNEPKDLIWTKRQINNTAARAVLTGKSIPGIAKELSSVAQSSYSSAMRTARTMMTACENRGRIAAYDRAEQMGIGLKKQWLSTLDSRTRWSHVELDSEIVGIHEAFSNGLQYPGDADGPGGEVYNCRCTLVPVVDGIDMSDAPRVSKLGEMSYEEWKQQAVKKSPAAQLKAKQLELADLQGQLNALSSIEFEGIWKYHNPTPADYVNLSTPKYGDTSAIDVKKQWYEEQLKKPDLSMSDAQKYTEFLEDLELLETKGKEYVALKAKADQIKAEITQLKPRVTPKHLEGIDSEAYSQERKNAALWAKSAKTADKSLRPKCGEVWRNLTDDERAALYRYTHSFHDINEPLRGIEYGTEKKLGVGNTDLNNHKQGKLINDMTNAIDQCDYDFDMWLQRGIHWKGADNFFGIDISDLQRLSQDELADRLVGIEVCEKGFMSCGCAKGKGFTNTPVILNVYCPQGTKMMYLEPFSQYGEGVRGTGWDGISTQSSFGDEAEVLLQQGTRFNISKVEARGQGLSRKLYVDLEVIGRDEAQLWQP